jgi:hypothetical protein
MWPMDEFESQLQRIAREVVYPPTPIIRWRAQRRSVQARYALATLAVLLALVMISPLRANVLEWLRIGVVTIFTGETAAPASTMPSLVDLFGETTLEAARESVEFDVRLPQNFGLPDHVYMQNGDGAAVIMVWLARENQPAISLYVFGATEGIYGKFLDTAVNTQVNGQPAVWADVPHSLQYQVGNFIRKYLTFIVEGNVLIWAEDGITYRLESNLLMEEAIAIAESLR